MTLDLLLTWVETHNVELVVDGERLIVEAPPGVLTDTLREELAAHKPALLALLVPVREFVTLKGGLVLPLPALELAWAFEARGLKLSLRADETISIEPTDALTEMDRAGIDRWRRHLAAIVAYDADADGGLQ